ncbi:MAG: HrcA family transcriptional regulator, partial [Candidatus Margulisiibacteriota bacterium]
CQVVIGSESPLEGLQNCSLVVSPIKHDQTPIGVVGVLGPKRMTYATVVPLVQKISEMITNSLPNSYESKEDQHAHR